MARATDDTASGGSPDGSPAEESTGEGMAEQLSLLPFRNPLDDRFGREFFRGIPDSPGIYRMFGEHGILLYVGKAKSLRKRLASYRSSSAERLSSKTIRLLRMIRRIEWESCQNEKDALILENRLLRTLKPPFNVQNTRPEAYLFVGFVRAGSELRFRLTHSPDPENDEVFGAFKGGGRVRGGYGALLRLLWAAHWSGQRFAYPLNLLGRRVPGFFKLEFEPSEGDRREWASWIRRFLNGTSRILLVKLTAALAENDDLPKFYRAWIAEDLQAADYFYELGPRRNKHLRRSGNVEGSVIARDVLDDLIVIRRMEGTK